MSNAYFPKPRKLPSGRYQVRWVDATDRSHSVGTFPTRREAVAALDEVRFQIRSGVIDPMGAPSDDGMTVAEYVEDYLDRQEANPDRAANTVQTNRILARVYILETIKHGRRSVCIADVPIRDLSPELVLAWVEAVRTYAHQRQVDQAKANAERKAVSSRTKAIRSWAQDNGMNVAASGRLSRDVIAAWLAAGSPSPNPVPVLPSAKAGEAAARHAFRLLRAVCNDARKYKLITENPCTDPMFDGAGNYKSKKTKPLSDVEIESIIAALPELQLRVLVRLMARFGNRRGEALGLRRKDVTFNYDGNGAIVGGTLRIEQQAKYENGRMVIGALKTDESERALFLELYPGVAAELSAFMAARDDDPDDALIFHNPGTPYRPLDARWVLRKFKIAGEQIGRPDAKLHSLRHTAGSYLSANGASAPYVQAFLGHANMRTTENYLHVMAEETNRIAARLRGNFAAAA